MRAMILAVLFALAACASNNAPPASDELYKDLGGRAGIARLVDEFMFRVLNDARIAHHFANTDLERLNGKLKEKFCAEAGGPCAYTGDTMSDVHRGLGVTRADFNALVEDLRVAMETLHVPQSAQNRLLARFAPMQAEIVRE
ncbi:MAG TPA: group 1 truncated hemoglobin [Gammaproteobacteria bacterium]